MYQPSSWKPIQSQPNLRISGDRKEILGSVINVPSGLRMDPDRIDTSEILSKLDHYQEKNYVPLVNPMCECSKRIPTFSEASSLKKETLKDLLKYDSDSSSTMSDEEAEDDLTLDYVLEKLDCQRRKAVVSSHQKALINLIMYYKGQEELNEEAISKLIAYLHTENIQMREAGLLLLQQCCEQSVNVSILIKHGILNDLELIITSRTCRPVHHTALNVWQKIIQQSSLKSLWWEPMNTLLPKLWDKLSKEKVVDIKVAILRILKTLSNNSEGATLVSSQGMPTLMSIRDKNADVKECCAEVLTGLVSHGNPTEFSNMDSSGITVSVNLLIEGPCGPQLQSLKLVSSLCGSFSGHSDLINSNIIPLVVSALCDSKCRKVKSEAVHVLGQILETRKPGQIKDIMSQAAEYFDHCDGARRNNLTSSDNHMIYPVKLKTDNPSTMERTLQKLINKAMDFLCDEGGIERNSFGQPVSIGLSPNVDRGTGHLQAMSHVIGLLQTVCCLPWYKHPQLSTPSTPAQDFTGLIDAQKIRQMLSHVKPHLSQTVWEISGTAFLDILTVYSRFFQSKNTHFITTETASQILWNQKTPKKSLYLSELFSPDEIVLINSLLNMSLIFASCSCEKVESQGQQKYDRLKSMDKLPTDTSRPKSAKSVCTDIPDNRKSENIPCDSNQPMVVPDTSVENIFGQSKDCLQKKKESGIKTIKVKSPRCKSPDKSTIRPSSAKCESNIDQNNFASCKKEMDGLRRLMRRSLFEAGVFEAVTPFLLCSDIPCKVLATEILRCLIQPLEEKVLKINSVNPKPLHHMQRPMSATTVRERNTRVVSALDKMSPAVAKVISEALADDKTPQPLQLLPKPPPSVIQQSWVGPDTKSQKNFMSHKYFKHGSLKPKIDVIEPIAAQCRQSLLNSVGPDLLTGLFSKNKDVKRHTLLLLEDMVQNGDVELHMKLSEYGCMPKLVDFLRANEDDELMEITALIITRILVSSDVRLKEVFERHGGSNLLMAMTRYTKGLLKEEVTLTLKTVNKAPSTKGRPQSAPARPQADIWGKISQRWKQEDKVSEILQQWCK